MVTSHLASPSSQTHPPLGRGAFAALVLLIVGSAVLRSAIATRLDDFTLDEAYHIVAGISYVQRGDFRINPEHPPLVKLWVGSVVSVFNDKDDERSFVNDAVYLRNDPEALQHRARVAMFALNSVLLALFAFALRRVVGPWVALGTLAFLAIDPTVAAHLPVVMTDLPISLLSATALLFAWRAFRHWNAPDLAACAVVLGLALATKHSAPVFAVFIALAGLLLVFAAPIAGAGDRRARRLAQLFAVLLGALVILWASYLFRYTEGSTPAEAFNRPLAAKIGDLRSPLKRFLLTEVNAAHLLPRAYIWGLADTLRGGVEGRIETRLVFGQPRSEAPAYFFPAVVAVKLPIGLDALIVVGFLLFAVRGSPAGSRGPVVLLLLAAVGYFIVLAHGAGYAGMRHALPAMVLLSGFAGVALQEAGASRGHWLKGMVALAFLAAAASALPVLRPWEYYNEIVGGSDKAYLYFSDEGVDLDQRYKEIARYYHEVLEPAGEVPFLQYLPFEQEAQYLRLDWVGRDPKRDEPRYSSRVFSGTIIVKGRFLGPSLFLDWAALREATPAARFGDVFVFRGSYDIGPLLADDLYYRARFALFSDKPDPVAAERFLRQAAAFDPSAFYVFIELGNIYLARSSRSQALEAFTSARDHAPPDTVFWRELEAQVRLLSSSAPLTQIHPLRDPALE